MSLIMWGQPSWANIKYLDSFADDADDEEYIDDAQILSDVLSVVRRITGAEWNPITWARLT